MEKSRLNDDAEAPPDEGALVDAPVELDDAEPDAAEEDDDDVVGGCVACAGEDPHAAAVRAAVASTEVKASLLMVCKGSSSQSTASRPTDHFARCSRNRLGMRPNGLSFESKSLGVNAP